MFELVIVLLALTVVVLYFRKATRPLWRRGGEQDPCAGCLGCSGSDSCPDAGKTLHQIDHEKP